MVQVDPFAVGTACFGGCLQELVHWYDAKTQLSSAKYDKLLRSARYWIVCGLMIIASGIGTWVWYYPESQTLRTYLLCGAAFPIVFKKLVSVFISRERKLGVRTDSESAPLRDYFSVA